MRQGLLILSLLITLKTALFAFEDKDYEFQIGMFIGIPAQIIESTYTDRTAIRAGGTVSILPILDSQTALMVTLGVNEGSFNSNQVKNGTFFCELQYVKDFSDHRFGVGASYHYGLRADDNTSYYAGIKGGNTLGYVLSYQYMLKEMHSPVWIFFPPLYFLGYVGLKYEYLDLQDSATTRNYSLSTVNVLMGFNF